MNAQCIMSTFKAPKKYVEPTLALVPLGLQGGQQVAAGDESDCDNLPTQETPVVWCCLALEFFAKMKCHIAQGAHITKKVFFCDLKDTKNNNFEF